MARYYTPVRDFVGQSRNLDKQYKPINHNNSLEREIGNGRFGNKTIQAGIMEFGRKKKNGSKLLSQSRIRVSVEGTTRKHKIVSYRSAFPKIKLDASGLTV